MIVQNGSGEPTRTKSQSRRPWLLLVQAFLGVWLVAFTLGTRGIAVVVIDDLLIGVLIVLMAVYNLDRVAHDTGPRTDLAVAGAMFGLWLLAFSLQYASNSPLRWNSAVVGVLLTLVNTAYYRTNRPWD